MQLLSTLWEREEKAVKGRDRNGKNRCKSLFSLRISTAGCRPLKIAINTTLSAAILRVVVSVRGAKTTRRICDKSNNYLTSQLCLLALHWQRANKHGRALNSSYPMFCIHVSRATCILAAVSFNKRFSSIMFIFVHNSAVNRVNTAMSSKVPPSNLTNEFMQ